MIEFNSCAQQMSDGIMVIAFLLWLVGFIFGIFTGKNLVRIKNIEKNKG